MDYDVVIVGASTAGLLAAELLAKGGKKVGLFERENGLSQEERTYIITPALYKIYSDFPSDVIRHSTDTFQIHSCDRSSFIHLSSPDIIINRNQMIQKLADKARNAGVHFNFNCEFLGLERTAEKLSPCFCQDGDKRIFTTDYLIGADGLHSKVRSSSGLKALEQVPLLQVEINLPDHWDDNITNVWFSPEDTPYFYWLIPDKNRQAVVGLITESGQDIQRLLDGFLRKNDFKALKYQSGQAAMYSKSIENETTIDNLKIFLVGDAAGQVKITTIGGTVTGFLGARAVASAIKENIPYNETFFEDKKELDLHLMIRNLLNQMNSHDYKMLLNLINLRVKSFLYHNNRDEMKSHFWKLVLLQPGFIPLGLKLMIRLLFSKTSRKDDSKLEKKALVT